MTAHVDFSNERNGKRSTVLYDGDCPICRREIKHYRRLGGAEHVAWIDITRHPSLEATFGVSPSQVLARFHVRRPDGVWMTGAWAFVELWTRLQGYRHLATFVRKLRLVTLLDWGYVRFARWRLRRRCSDGTCTAG